MKTPARAALAFVVLAVCGCTSTAGTEHGPVYDSGTTASDLGSCPGDETMCRSACVDLATSIDNCGECDNACKSGPHSTASCQQDRCVLECTPGYLDCDGESANGCEVDANTDPLHCGACQTICMAGSLHAAPACVDSKCTAGPCAPGFGDCNMDPSDGCETDLENDPNHCGSGTGTGSGACGAPCNGVPNDSCMDGYSGQVCSGGVCACPSGQSTCFDGFCGCVAGDAGDCAN